MELSTRITQQYSTMTNSEKKIAEFILHHPEETVTLNMRALAEAVNVSSATVVRFVRTVGFDSYSSMRLALACGAEIRANTLPGPFKQQDFSLEYAQMQHGNLVVNAIVQTRCIQTRAALSAAAEAINNAKSLYLFGVGTSGMAADTFQHKMLNINKQCLFFRDGALSVVSTAHSLKDSVALGISYSGGNRDVLFAMESCRANGAVTVGVTQARSPLSKHLDMLLPVPYVEDGLCEGGNLSIYAQLTVLDMLYLTVLGIARQEKEKSLTESKQAIQRHSQL